MDIEKEYFSVVEALCLKLKTMGEMGITEVFAPKRPDSGLSASAGEPVFHEGEAAPKAAGAAASKSPAVVFACGVPAGEDASSPVGGEGEQLKRIIKYMALGEADYHVTYAVRCAAPSGLPPRDPLEKELEGSRPRIILAMGPAATTALLGSCDVKKLRGRFHDYKGIKVMPTWGPGELIKDPALKKEARRDIDLVLDELKKRI